MCVPGAKGGLESLELELQMVMNLHISAESSQSVKARSSLRAGSAFDLWDISAAPTLHPFSAKQLTSEKSHLNKLCVVMQSIMLRRVEWGNLEVSSKLGSLKFETNERVHPICTVVVQLKPWLMSSFRVERNNINQLHSFYDSMNFAPFYDCTCIIL